MTTRQLRSAKAALDDLWSQLSVVEVTAGLVADGVELADTERLRGYDAVHLAAAIKAVADVLASADQPDPPTR